MCRTLKHNNTNTKYTNTQIQYMTKCQKRSNKWHIFEKRIVQGYQKYYSHVSNMQIHKYKYTNTQIQHMTECQKNPTCSIFLKKGLFKGIKNYIPMCQKGDCSRMSSESRTVVQGLVMTMTDNMDDFDDDLFKPLYVRYCVAGARTALSTFF